MRDIKLPQVRLELARLLTTRHKFVCFDVTSRVDNEFASERKSEGRGFESHMRLTFYLESKTFGQH